MKEKLRNISLYQRLLIIIIVLALFPLLIFSYTGYKMFSNLMLKMIAESNLKTMEQVQLQSERIYEDINDILTRVSIHPDVQRMMNEESISEWDSYMEARNFSEFTNNLLVSHSEIANISIINFNGKRIDSLGRFLPIQLDDKMAKMVKQLKTRSVAIGSIHHTQSGENLISFGKMIVDVKSGKPLGLVTLDVNLEILDEEFKKVTLLKSGYVYLLNEKNQVIYHPSKSVGQQMEKLPETEKHYFLKKGQNGEDYLYLIKKLPSTHWVLTGIIPYKEVTDENVFIRNAFFVFLILMMIALLFVAFLLKKVLVNPISKMQTLMNSVQEGNFQVRTKFHRNDEIGKLGAAFNGMVAQIDNLIERVYQVELNESRALLLQKQAELEALQERITPHFLYNTLNSISWFANQKGIREIEYVIDSLSNMLRYSVGNGSNLVRLKDEFAYIKLYAEIIDFRFDGSITFTYSLSPSLEDVLIPRLSLQPIVENVVKYAFDHTETFKKIEVSAFEEGDQVWVMVKDNGDGISNEKVNRINESLNVFGYDLSAQLTRKEEFEHVGGIGLKNVHQRLKLTFGEKYGVQLQSRIGEGTIVRVKLPLKKIS
ncbi:cache domain-containing sensor histidine kinase [Neobacillus cucumis]|uniref:histidine kinase n=1 Tax=Neobacillus cucumis TaxID=1740721 RepID=A0A2N5HVT3_9BACI|nr:sensor histidine kinase [Neobacillus cucumis]PLS09628.1 hypothetical protein CVD27_01980 [Neobacillus cucumis]